MNNINNKKREREILNWRNKQNEVREEEIMK